MPPSTQDVYLGKQNQAQIQKSIKSNKVGKEWRGNTQPSNQTELIKGSSSGLLYSIQNLQMLYC